MTTEKAKTLIPKIALVVGVLIIPLMYSYFYLNAFWDPYQRLDAVPVAVVNEDRAADINGTSRCIGDEICDQLKEEGTVDFSFVDAKEAKDGLFGNEYYASITIPRDFSANAATVGEDTEKLHSLIIYSANQKKNFLAAQILENAMPKIKESVNSKIDGQIIGTLADTIKEVPGQLEELDSGLGKISAGAGTLKDGTAALSGGAGELADGTGKLAGKVPTLKNGIGKLDKGAGTLSKGLGTLTKNNKALNEGAGQLSSGTATLNKGIGSYTAGVEQAGKGATTLGTGVKQYTAGVDQIAAGQQTLDEGLSKTSAGVNQIVSQVKTSADELDKQASDESLNTLSGGAKQVADGASELSSKYKTFVEEQAPQLIAAYKQAAAADPAKAEVYLQKLTGGMQQFETKMGELSAGASQVNGGVGTLTSGMKDVKSNMSTLIGGLEQVQGAFGSSTETGTLLGGSAQLKAGLEQLQSNSSTLNTGASQLDGGLKTINKNNKTLTTGASQLNSGAKVLKSGISKYTQGAGAAKTGAQQISAGTGQLAESMPTLSKGVYALDTGADKLAKGATQLDDGTGTLKAGIDTAADGVGTAVGNANSQVGKLDGLSEYGEEPVKTKTEYIQEVANYGSAFAPYFMGLSLWVGGLLIFFGIYYDFHRRIRVLSRDSNRVVARTFFFSLVSIGQALLLAFVIKSVLHIAVNNTMMLYGSCILAAMTFTAIIQFCIVDLGDIGKFLAMLLLILQLTSCAGTFPLETQNAFFRAINPFLPMTYSTQLFKEAISGTAGSNAAHSAIALAIFLLVFGALTILFSHKAIGKDLKRMAEDAKNHAAA